MEFQSSKEEQLIKEDDTEKQDDVRKSGDNEDASSKSNTRHDMSVEEQITRDKRKATEEVDTLQASARRTEETMPDGRRTATEVAGTIEVGNMDEESTNYSSHKQPTRDENTDGNTEVKTTESVCVTGVSGKNWV
ncbi:uncharacterized protein LOC130046309 [Ostrea edulis]|uniref:uncharacterized protein LOC130046309 n=1 Tax=Ostrea edulis TaxID=37623 RepID=UPI0024AEBFAA|nr:uncharacterized protein LOC130046309 [Ostrea edulis]